MKISRINNNLTFNARRKDVKKADTIKRRTTSVFPMVSDTYFQTFYKISKKSKPGDKVSEIERRLDKKIATSRMAETFPNLYGKDFPRETRDVLYGISLDGIKQNKAGNCTECSKATMAVLCANGYYNSERMNLVYRSEFVNRMTGETDYVIDAPLDHSLVVTDMNEGEKDIVIDSWMSFADTKEGAISRYKDIYDKKDQDAAVDYSIKKLCKQHSLEEKYVRTTYRIKSRMDFAPADPYATAYQLKRLGEYARENYKGIVIEA